MREPHVLNKTKTAAIPKRMIFFDSESHTNIEITNEEIIKARSKIKVKKIHDPYLICSTFLDGHKNKRGSGVEERDYHGTGFISEFWQDVDKFARTNERTYVFAHNAKYDVQVTECVHYMVNLGYMVEGFSDANPFILRLTKTITHSPVTGVEYKNEKHKTIIILSSTNYYQQSLAKLGEIFNLPKLDFAHDQKFSIEEAVIYCRRDVEILVKAMTEFITFVDRENMGSFAMTVAGQAFASFRHRFMKDNTIYIHNNKRALAVERRAYAGGRNECFRMGIVKGVTHVYDVNSMYPASMIKHSFPTKLKTIWNECSLDELRGILKKYLVCADVLVETDTPIFYKKSDRLTFPVGEFWTTLSTPEIERGLELGLIRQVKNVCVYDHEPIFYDYVDYFYKRRLGAKNMGDSINDHLYKIFLSALYGKFGQKNVKWEKIGDADPSIISVDNFYYPDEGGYVMQKTFGGGVFVKNKDVNDMEAYHSFPAVAAHVTAHSRMMLYDYRQAAGVDNVFYCDTDSIFTNKEGGRHLEKAGLVNPDTLGLLKHEKEGQLVIYGCKDYVFNDEAKIKGISKNGSVPLGYNEEGHLQFAVTQWGGFSDRLRDQNFSSYYNKVIIKTLKRNYTKGSVEGEYVYPFKLSENLTQLKEGATLEEWVDSLGRIKTVQRGEPRYKEYRKLPDDVRISYFGINGTPLKQWCADAGKDEQKIMDELKGVL